MRRLVDATDVKDWAIRRVCWAVMLWPLGAAWLAWVLVAIATEGGHHSTITWFVGLVLAALGVYAFIGWNDYLDRTRWGQRIQWTAEGRNLCDLELRWRLEKERARL